MAKIAATAIGAVVVLIVIFVAAAAGLVSVVLGGDNSEASSAPSPVALADIPDNYLTLYQQAAATCPGLDWSIVAAIGKIESNHGRSNLPGVHNGANAAGAGGPMQFLPQTFGQYTLPIPPGGANPPSPYDPTDAIYAAVRLLCASGGRNNQDVRSAVYAYNHDDHYVTIVLATAADYAAPLSTRAQPSPPAPCPSAPPPALAASLSGQLTGASPEATAVEFACGQLGKPYIWGGNGNPGFDCSGLTVAAYAAAGINLPRTAQDQYDAGSLLPPGTPLQPGDLVFYGTSPASVEHVGIAISTTQMIDAPHAGADVQIDAVGRYLAASRPRRSTSV
jgi:cell wall-associated NlpC family hydrolase